MINLGLVVSVFLLSGCQKYSITATQNSVTHEVSFGNYTIKCHYTHDHAFLAEYKRVISISRDGKELNSDTLDPDTGGGFPAMLKLYGTNTIFRIRYIDSLGAHYLYDGLTGLRVPGQNPYPGKITVNYVKEDELPPLLAAFRIEDFTKGFVVVTQTTTKIQGVVPNGANLSPKPRP